MDLTTTLVAQIQAQMQKTVLNATPQYTLNHKVEDTLSDGTGADKADLCVEVDSSLGVGANTTIDLAGSLSDIFGDAVTFARIKALLIENESTDADAVLIVGGAGANPWPGPFQDVSDKIEVRPGGAALFFCADATGWPVVGGASDVLKIENESGANACSYRITFVGEAA